MNSYLNYKKFYFIPFKTSGSSYSIFSFIIGFRAKYIALIPNRLRYVIPETKTKQQSRVSFKNKLYFLPKIIYFNA